MAEATLAEQMEITRILVNAVHMDVGIHSIVAIKPKPVFRLLFEEICEGISVKLSVGASAAEQDAEGQGSNSGPRCFGARGLGKLRRRKQEEPG